MELKEKHTNPLYFVGLCIAVSIYIYYYSDTVFSFIFGLDPILMILILAVIFGVVVLSYFIFKVPQKVEGDIHIHKEANGATPTQYTQPTVSVPYIQELNIGVFTGIKFGFGFALGMILAGVFLILLFGSFMLSVLKAILS